jgi:WD40 repeat protein
MLQNLLPLLLIASAFFCLPASAIEPPITALTFAADGNAVVASSQSGLHVFSWPELKRQRVLEASAANLDCIAFSPRGHQLAVGGGFPAEEGIVQVFSWPAGDPAAILRGHDDSISAVLWHDASQLLVASLDCGITLRELGKRKSLVSFSGHSRGVAAICLLQDGKTLVSAGDDQSVRVWDFKSGEPIRSLNQHTGPVHALALRPDREGLPMVASAAGDRTIRFWQPTIGRMVRYVRLDAEPLNIAWLKDGSRIAAACVDGRLRLIDADQAKVTDDLPAIQGWAYAIAAHPSDGSVAVGGSGGQVSRIVLQDDTASVAH